MSEKFKPLKTMEATCKECGHVGMIECSDKQANAAVVNFVAQFRCQIESLKAELEQVKTHHRYDLEQFRKCEDERDRLQTEVNEQARLLGISGSKEAKLLVRVERLEKALTEIVANDEIHSEKENHTFFWEPDGNGGIRGVPCEECDCVQKWAKEALQADKEIGE